MALTADNARKFMQYVFDYGLANGMLDEEDIPQWAKKPESIEPANPKK